MEIIMEPIAEELWEIIKAYENKKGCAVPSY